MWDDVTIGKPCNACSATHIFAIEGDHSISENTYDYWVITDFLRIGMKISKATVIGRKLTKLINDKVPEETISLYLDGVALKHIHPTKLRDKIETALKLAYADGREDIRADFRKLLKV